MNLKELKEIIAVFEQADISELDLERQGVKIRLKKTAEPMQTVQTVQLQPREISQASVPPCAGEEGVEETTRIKAPIVGTFYRAPAPDASPFVEEGDEIHEGQVICIIEAMKLMNEIKSEVNGTVKKVLVENGQAVEFDQPIFVIQKA